MISTPKSTAYRIALCRLAKQGRQQEMGSVSWAVPMALQKS